MQIEGASPRDHVSAGLIARATTEECMLILGSYHAQHIRDGKVLWEEDFPNVVTTEGKNAILDKFLGLGAAYAAVAVGLHTTVGNAASTYATPSPQVEFTGYSGNRGVPSFNAASGGAKATSAAVAFSITAAGPTTITGAFCCIGAAGISTPGNTAAVAVLLSSGSFSASRSVISGDTLNVSYTLTLT